MFNEMALNKLNDMFTSMTVDDVYRQKILGSKPTDVVDISNDDILFMKNAMKNMTTIKPVDDDTLKTINDVLLDNSMNDILTDAMNESFVIPADIFFTNTIPLLDVVFEECPNDPDCSRRTRIKVLPKAELQHNLLKLMDSDAPEKVTGAIIEHVFVAKKLGTTLKFYTAIEIYGDNSNLGFDKMFKLWPEECKSLIDRMSLAEKMILFTELDRSIMVAISYWYVLQQSLLNPVLKTYVSRVKPSPTKKNPKRNPPKQTKISFIKMMRDIDINPIKKTAGTKTIKKSLWYVTGHWRTYKKSGKKIFIQGYWKGSLRDVKTEMEAREREIVLSENMVL